MHDTEKIPLRIHLGLSPQCETVEPDGRGDMSKGRLAYRQPHAVKNPADIRIDLTLHPLCKGMTSFLRSPYEICHLPYLRTLRMPQALATERAWQTRRLGTLELVCPKILHRNIAAASV